MSIIIGEEDEVIEIFGSVQGIVQAESAKREYAYMVQSAWVVTPCVKLKNAW